MKGMSARHWRFAILLVGFSSAGGAMAAERDAPARYLVTNLPSLGGTVSSGNSLNDLGWASGTSNLSGDTVQHATLWLEGWKIDLRTHGGPNSGIIWPVNNDSG